MYVYKSVLACGLLLMVCGCAPSASVQNEPSATTDNAPVITITQGVSDAQREKMLAAKDELFKRLSGRLMEVMSTQGPVAAIAVCQTEATLLAQAVSQETGLKIGRTGVRLRNPQNQAPDWAIAEVHKRIESPWWATLDDGRSVGLLPIKLQAQCLMCHGPSEDISPDVRQQLKQLYPDDAATGFREGELRGWFWIEHPATAQ